MPATFADAYHADKNSFVTVAKQSDTGPPSLLGLILRERWRASMRSRLRSTYRSAGAVRLLEQPRIDRVLAGLDDDDAPGVLMSGIQ